MWVRLFNQFIDLVSNTDLKKAADESDKFDFLSREDIEKYQKIRFKKLIEYAITSEFYKKFVNSEYSEFPVIRRDEYVKNQERMITNYNNKYYISVSSGSTGVPVKHYITREMLLMKRASHQKMLKWYGLKRDSREMKLGGIKCGYKEKIYYYLKNKRYFNSFYVNSDNYQKIIKKYKSFKPEILYGYPSTINRFLMFANEKNDKLNPPKIIVCHAENLSPEVKENFIRFFPDVKVVNQYWSTEANIAETCPEGNLHINENSIICELINKNIHGVGELLITNLFSFRVPLIRYSVGDMIKISDKPCPCGRNTRTIEHIEGRTFEYLETIDGQRFPITGLDYYTHKEILSYQLVYFRNENRIVLKYVPIDANKTLHYKEIEDYFKDNFKLEMSFEQVNDIECSSSGKVKKIIIID